MSFFKDGKDKSSQINIKVQCRPTVPVYKKVLWVEILVRGMTVNLTFRGPTVHRDTFL